MTLDELQSKTIDFTRFPLAVGIVFIHATGSIGADTINQINCDPITGNTVYNILGIIFSNLIFQSAVPFFFIVSGYLYFSNVKYWNKEQYIKKSRSRLKSLILPYCLWNLLGFLIAISQGVFVFSTQGEVSPIMEQITTVFGWLKPFWNQWQFGPLQDILGNSYYITYPYIGALWFLRDLIGISLLSPLVYVIVKYTRVWGLLILFLALYTNIWWHIPGFGIQVFFYFSLGAYLGVHKKNMVQEARRFKTLAAFLCLVSLFFASYGTPSFLPFVIPLRLSILVFVITMCITFMNISSWLIESGKAQENKSLTKTTFFIFAAHGLVLSVLNNVFHYIFRSDSILVKVSQFIICPIFVVFICVLVYYILNRSMPKLLSVLVGSR